MVTRSFIDRYYVALFLAPALLLLLGLIVIPAVVTLGFSTLEWTLTKPGSRAFVGIHNYLALVTRYDFVAAMRNTAVFVVCTVAIETVFGFSIATLLNRQWRLSAIGRGVVLLPMMLSPLATAITWRAMFFQQQYGLINYVLGLVGIHGPGWLGDRSWTLVTVMIMDVWLATPFMTLFMLAGLQSIPQSQIESAQLDGANRFQLNVRIILPMMKNIVMVAVVLRTIFNLRVFETIYALTRGGPGLSSTTLGILAYREAFTLWRIGNSGTMATILFLVSLALCVLYIRLMQRERRTTRRV